MRSPAPHPSRVPRQQTDALRGALAIFQQRLAARWRRQAPSSQSSRQRRSLHFRKLRGLVLGEQRIDDLVERLTIHDLVDFIERQVDSVIGDTALRKVISADALRPVAGADLAVAIGGARGLARLTLALIKASAQHFKRLGLVLVLRLLVLLAHHDAGRKMRDPHGAIGGVDGLSARTARAEHVYAQVLLVDPDVDLLRLGQHGNRRRGSMDAARGLGLRYALHPMHARFELEPLEDVASSDLGAHLLDPAEPRLGDTYTIEH